jgi:hypothetical protein
LGKDHPADHSTLSAETSLWPTCRFPRRTTSWVNAASRGT